jgi:hypothetical protein
MILDRYTLFFFTFLSGSSNLIEIAKETALCLGIAAIYLAIRKVSISAKIIYHTKTYTIGTCCIDKITKYMNRAARTIS